MGSAHDFDALEIARAHAEAFGKAQRAVALLKRRRAAIGHGIEAHDGGGHGIG